jgi:hypothetical protein
MDHYQELETAKFVRPVDDQRAKEWRRSRNRKALGDFLTFLFGLAAIGMTFHIVAELPTWIPAINRFFRTM